MLSYQFMINLEKYKIKLKIKKVKYKQQKHKLLKMIQLSEIY
jgi:hypothetical protein